MWERGQLWGSERGKEDNRGGVAIERWGQKQSLCLVRSTDVPTLFLTFCFKEKIPFISSPFCTVRQSVK